MACQPFVCTTNSLCALESPREISTGGSTENSADWSTEFMIRREEGRSESEEKLDCGLVRGLFRMLMCR